MSKLKELRLFRNISIVLCVVSVLIVGTVLCFIWALYNEPAPQFFPLNNIHGNYEVVKCDSRSQGTDKTVTNEGRLYCVEYTGRGVWMEGEENNPKGFFRVVVGKSNVDLSQFIGRKITYIDGEWDSSEKQCVLENCREIGGPFVVLNINSLVASK